MKLRNTKDKNLHNDLNLIKIDFSLKREILYVVIGALIGAITMILPRTIYEFITGQPYYISWIIFGHVIGIYSSYAATAGFIIHLITAVSIGLVTGIFLYKTNILNISKPLNGFFYGIFAGTIIFVVWAIPINEFVLIPENIRTIADIDPSLPKQAISQQIESNKLSILFNSLFINLLFGITVGLASSVLSIKFGTRYKCNICNVSFSRINIIRKHLQLVHRRQPIEQKKIAILGGGFAGIEVLTKLQKEFQNDIRVDITLISKDNYFLFTPMLHEVSSGMIEPRHVASPLRSFCKRARFIESEIKSIDLENRKIEFTNQVLEARFTSNKPHNIKREDKKIDTLSNHLPSVNSLDISNVNMKNDNNNNNYAHTNNDQYVKSLWYDYLVIALGSNTNFFGNKNIEKSSFTMKSLYDAFSIRSHIIDTLEQTDILLFEEKKDVVIDQEIKTNKNNNYLLNYKDNENIFENTRKSLITYVVVGGGFAGVETIGEINDFIKESIKDYYQNIDIKDVRVILINSGPEILPEMDERLGKFALEELKKKNVEVILNNRVIDVKSIIEGKEDKENQVNLRGPKKIILKDNSYIIADTLIWTAGVVPEKSVIDISCEHDKSGKVVTDKYLQIKGHRDVYAIGDCAYIIEPDSGKPCPPTAQHAIREGQITAENISSSIKKELKFENTIERKEKGKKREINEFNKKEFSYKTRGIMATIGKRNGVAMIFGYSIKGIFAWGIWRFFYLTHLPTLENKLRVMIDWGIDMMFGRNLTRLKSPIETKDMVSRKDIDK
ncbi:MAG TPA: NAD(P)/FAD-dependent oxidoreductase [Nitrososphaeraceae archaeon]|nr:NAD(P)/FAD-dependent oxidoreductase [Nitrososphaeraceae archaeon]